MQDSVDREHAACEMDRCTEIDLAALNRDIAASVDRDDVGQSLTILFESKFAAVFDCCAPDVAANIDRTAISDRNGEELAAVFHQDIIAVGQSGDREVAVAVFGVVDDAVLGKLDLTDECRSLVLGDVEVCNIILVDERIIHAVVRDGVSADLHCAELRPIVRFKRDGQPVFGDLVQAGDPVVAGFRRVVKFRRETAVATQCKDVVDERFVLVRLVRADIEDKFRVRADDRMQIVDRELPLDQDRAAEIRFELESVQVHDRVRTDGRALQCAAHQAQGAAVDHEVGRGAGVDPVSAAVDHGICDGGIVIAEESACLDGQAVDPAAAVEPAAVDDPDVLCALAVQVQSGVRTIGVHGNILVVPALGVEDDGIAPVTPGSSIQDTRFHVIVLAVFDSGLAQVSIIVIPAFGRRKCDGVLHLRVVGITETESANRVIVRIVAADRERDICFVRVGRAGDSQCRRGIGTNDVGHGEAHGIAPGTRQAKTVRQACLNVIGSLVDELVLAERNAPGSPCGNDRHSVRHIRIVGIAVGVLGHRTGKIRCFRIEEDGIILVAFGVFHGDRRCVDLRGNRFQIQLVVFRFLEDAQRVADHRNVIKSDFSGNAAGMVGDRDRAVEILGLVGDLERRGNVRIDHDVQNFSEELVHVGQQCDIIPCIIRTGVAEFICLLVLFEMDLVAVCGNGAVSVKRTAGPNIVRQQIFAIISACDGKVRAIGDREPGEFRAGHQGDRAARLDSNVPRRPTIFDGQLAARGDRNAVSCAADDETAVDVRIESRPVFEKRDFHFFFDGRVFQYAGKLRVAERRAGNQRS